MARARNRRRYFLDGRTTLAGLEAMFHSTPAAAVVCLTLGCGDGGDGIAGSAVPAFTAPPVGEMSSPAPPANPEPPAALAPPEPIATDTGENEGTPDVTLEAPSGASEGADAPPLVEMPAPAEPPSAPTLDDPPVECVPFANLGSLDDGDINVDLGTQFQAIAGFGGINVPGWIADLTPEQTETAFNRGPGQLGLSILRVRVPFDTDQFAAELPTARRAVELGARVMASPWTPPANLKSNNSTVGGELVRANYGAYAEHLLSFRDFLADNGVPLAALSIQNEPDIRVDYESCDWTSEQLADFLIEQGPRFGDTRLIAAESFNFNRQMTDPLLNDARAAAEFEIVGGHIYGNGLADYPLARQRGKAVWMTEHYTDSNSSANAWPNALNVGVEIQDVMQANFSAYIWWYIRRSYGMLTEDGQVSKRGYIMSQFARFVRPGFVRVAASQPGVNGVRATAYANGPGKVVVEVLNQSTAAQAVTLDIFGACVDGFNQFTTSATENASAGTPVQLENNRVSVTLDAQSLTTFVSQ